MLTLTRKQQLLEAFREAGRRGLTGAEMAGVVGEMWRLRLRELQADGVLLLEHPSRTRPGTIFRWSLVSEHALAPGDDGHLALFDAGELRPAPGVSAVFGEPSS